MQLNNYLDAAAKMGANSKSKVNSNINKLLPVHSSLQLPVWHTVGVWIPDALIKCKDRSRHGRLWCNSPDKTSSEQCVSRQLSSCPCFTPRLSALMAFQAGSIKQGVPVVQSRDFISPLGASDLLISWEKKESNDKEEFQHEKIWWGRELLKISSGGSKLQ